ncbi:MAG TPA: DUF2892 domain-containing protein [Deltaproteobacteria bacterium]|nr:DUF2892 domain-containing protein [Deltaproteobacteria bacterium]
MEQNVGFQDRMIRLGVALAVVALYLLGWLKGKAGLLLVVAGALLSSAASGYCPLYEQLGTTTKAPAKGH